MSVDGSASSGGTRDVIFDVAFNVTSEVRFGPVANMVGNFEMRNYINSPVVKFLITKCQM